MVVLVVVALRERKDDMPSRIAEEVTTASQQFLVGGDVVLPLTDGQYDVNTEASSITWEGTGVGKKHMGTIPVSGTFAITQGVFAITKDTPVLTFDLARITSTDPSGSNEQLLAHLKSPDFFDVATYPTASLQITSITPRTEYITNKENALADTAYPTDPNNAAFTGELTMRGSTVPVSGIAMFSAEDTMVHFTGNLSIDRTQWGINFRSGSVVKDLGDKLIEDEVMINFDIVAKKNTI